MINKNFYRKTNDKKILHKVGKQWKVISVALLMAVAGGAVAATHANAAQTNDASNNQTNSLVDYLNTSAVANPPRIAAPSSKATSSSAAKSVAPSAINYYSGDNGSAAMYFDKTDNDNNTAAKYRGTVNAYVQSLNAEYNPQVHSFAVKSASAQSAASNDSKLASSYSVTAHSANTNNVITSLANKNHLIPSIYQGMVQNNEETYSNEVSSASNDVTANNTVASLVNKLADTDLSAASLSASTASVIANSNYSGAIAIQKSVGNYFNNDGKGIDAYINYANELSADANTLINQGNPAGINANLGMLFSNVDINSASAQSAFNSAVNTAVASAKSSFSNIMSSAANNDASLSSYAASYGSSDNLVTDYNSVSNSAITPTTANGSEGSEYFDAVSAATAEKFSNILASAATSLYSKYNVEYSTYQTRSAEYSSASVSASALVHSARDASNVASANQFVIDRVSGNVSYASTTYKLNSSEAAASVANSYLDEGVTSFESALGFYNSGDNQDYSNVIATPGATDDKYASHTDEYLPAINNMLYGDYSTAARKAAQSPVALLADIYGGSKLTITGGTTTKQAFSNAITSVVKTLQNAVKVLNDANGESDDFNFENTNVDNVNVNGFITNPASNKQNNRTVNSSKFSGASGDLVESLDTDVNSNDSSTLKGQVKSAVDAVLEDGDYGVKTADKGANLQTVAGDISNAATSLQTVANDAANVSATNYADTPGNTDEAASFTHGLKPNDSKTTPWLQPVSNEANDNVKAALLSDGVDLDALNAQSGAINNVASAAQSASSSAEFKGESSAEELANVLSVAASSANSAFNSADTASADYSAANDEDVTLSSYFASSYADAASDEANETSTESSELNSFFKSAADNATFNTADDAYSAAETAAANDYKLGVANAKSVYNRLPHFLDALKGARLHSTPNYGSNGDKVVGSVNKGDRLTVYGVNVSRNNDWRGVIRYYVLDNANGKKGFFTGQDGFSKGAYLPATANNSNVEVKTLKPVRVYSDYNSKHAIGTIPAGKVVENADVVYGSVATQDAHGFTKVETASDDFFTANTDYVEIVTPKVNTNNNVQSNYNFNLQNSNEKMGPYYNNNSQY